MSQVILPPAMLGMLGGGQLGRFFVIAAHEMGYRVTVLDPDPHSPAGKIADVHLCAQYDDAQALKQMAQTCVAVTTEFENVPAQTMQTLAQDCIVRPNANAVAVAQHRALEKQFIRDAGIPVAPFVVVNQTEDLPADDSALYPAILKVARFGYDGKGQARVANREQAKQAFADFKQAQCVLEKMLSLDYEVSVALARGADGNVVCFPTAENSHLNGILDVSIVPARAPQDIHQQAKTLAIKIAQSLDYVGVLAVEFFVSEGQLLANEMAPRPHNSGHYTIDACVTSQFEQQVRALAGLPLGDARQHSPSVMVNILGDVWYQNGQVREPDWLKCFEHGQIKLHLYGKHEPRPARKMGHFTALDEKLEYAIEAAIKARQNLGIGE